ncbi:MAG: hypothetical protein M5E90_03560 [Asgard group archaeon]|nr:hypothetical protein [Asgard group archaeon]
MKRQELRSKLQFSNPFQPFQNYSPISQIPKIPHILAQSIIKFVDSQPCKNPLDVNIVNSKARNRIKFTRLNNVSTRKTIKKRPTIHNNSDYEYDSSDDETKQDIDSTNSSNDYREDNTEQEQEQAQEEEVHLVYNKSNMPKYVGQFLNVFVDKRLKRKCKTCGAMYTDLKGFNRHYESKHL